MSDFFSQSVGRSVIWFGVEHFLIMTIFIFSMIFVGIFGKKLGVSKKEKIIRYLLIGLVFLFEWAVFEDRMLNKSIFRIPLCGIALYSLTFAIALKKEKVFKVSYFYAFGTILTFLFFDTPYALDRWLGWTYFGAHAMIGVLAVYGLFVFKWIPNKKDLYRSMFVLAIYAFVSGYATLSYGGSDELFLFQPPVDFLNVIKEFSQVAYTLIFSGLAAILMFLMYVPIVIFRKKTLNH